MPDPKSRPHSRWNPSKIRRCVRLDAVAPDGVIVFAAKSFTCEGPEDKYHPTVDTTTGAVLCDCPHFVYRLAKHNPTVNDADHLCKHLHRAISNLRRHGIAL